MRIIDWSSDVCSSDLDPLYLRPACDIGLQCVPIASRFDFPELGSEQLLTADRTLIAGASRRPLLMVPRKHGMPGLSLWKVDKPHHDDRTTRLCRDPARRPGDPSDPVRQIGRERVGNEVVRPCRSRWSPYP